MPDQSVAIAVAAGASDVAARVNQWLAPDWMATIVAVLAASYSWSQARSAKQTVKEMKLQTNVALHTHRLEFFTATKEFRLNVLTMFEKYDLELSAEFVAKSLYVNLYFDQTICGMFEKAADTTSVSVHCLRWACDFPGDADFANLPQDTKALRAALSDLANDLQDLEKAMTSVMKLDRST